VPDPLANIQQDGQPVAGAEEGNTRAVTHGVNATLALQPRTQVLAEYLVSIVPGFADSDLPSVWTLAGVLAQIEAGRAYIEEHGMLDKKGRPQPVMATLTTLQNTAHRMTESLGLTPASRAKLGLDVAKGQSLAAEIEATRAAGERSRARVAEGD
jgi:hypothetical protein